MECYIPAVLISVEVWLANTAYSILVSSDGLSYRIEAD